jgi:RNA polymerase sigma-70 factor, ECF subfamily
VSAAAIGPGDPWGQKIVEATFDAAWRERALAGEPRAVQALADAALTPLYAFCLYRVGRRRELCEEVVQETLVRAICDLALYDPARSGGEVWGWLTGLARNEIRRTLAREKSSTALTALWDRIDQDLLEAYARIESEPMPEQVLERQETCEMVNATMSQLPPAYRQALEAKYIEGRSVHDMAAAMAVSEKAVESQLVRARKAFRATFLALSRNVEPSV